MEIPHRITASDLAPELHFTASRSAGPGGQNVNKVNSKITLKFDIKSSRLLTPEQKEFLLIKLTTRVSAEGVLSITSQDSRSQFDNKEAAVQKLEQVLTKVFEKKKARKATKPSKSAVRERIKKKKQQAEKKQWRKKLDD